MTGPNLLIIGTTRVGMSSLSLASQHPEIGFSRPKEMHYLLDGILGFLGVTRLTIYTDTKDRE